MATIDQTGSTEMADFVEDVVTLYKDDGKIDDGTINIDPKSIEIQQLKDKYIDAYFFLNGSGEVDTAEEIDAIVADINADGKVDNVSALDERNRPVQKAYSSKIFSQDFINVVIAQIADKPYTAYVVGQVELVIQNVRDGKYATANHGNLELIYDHREGVTDSQKKEMVGLLKSGHANQREGAARFLSALDDTQTNRQILEVATDGHLDEATRLTAMSALFKLEFHWGLQHGIDRLTSITRGDRTLFENSLSAVFMNPKHSKTEREAAYKAFTSIGVDNSLPDFYLHPSKGAAENFFANISSYDTPTKVELLHYMGSFENQNAHTLEKFPQFVPVVADIALHPKNSDEKGAAYELLEFGSRDLKAHLRSEQLTTFRGLQKTAIAKRDRLDGDYKKAIDAKLGITNGEADAIYKSLEKKYGLTYPDYALTRMWFGD